METESTGKTVSTGICVFCKAEVAKNKVTQHLKFCKQRLSAIALQEKKSRKPKTRLFHILAEGKYNPQYWLHFEVPASEPLWSVDNFLKDMWIDDLDHLSGFTISGTDYSDDDNYSDEFYMLGETEESQEKEEEEELSEEEQAKKLSELIDTTISIYTERSLFNSITDVGVSLETDPHWREWIAELKKPRTVDELVDFLKQELVRYARQDKLELDPRKGQNPLDQGLSLEERYQKYLALHFQNIIVKSLLESVEDRSMDVSLEHVLKIGQKFTYTYDYGSSTYINLRVITEREGIVQNKKEPVQLLAQNVAPTFACIVCGKPATIVGLGYYTRSIEDNMYCTSCARKHVEEGQVLSIDNSPRTGVL